MQKEGIIFEPFAPYSQEQNSISKQTRKTIIDMTRATILERNINNDLWPELVLAITYMKNNWSTRALQNLSLYKAYTRKLPNLSHLRILGSTVYIFLHKEEWTLKSEKWVPRALKGTLVGYNGHTIYQVYLKNQKKVIWVKDLCIFEDYENKLSNKLPDYSEDTPTFQDFFLVDDDDEQLEADLHLSCIGQKAKDVEKANQSLPSHNMGRKVNDIELIPSKVITSTIKIRKIVDAEFRAEVAMKKTRISRTIKLSAKAKDARNIRERPSNPQKISLLEQSSEIENLIVQSTILFGSWDMNDKGIEIRLTQTEEDTKSGYEDLLRILATRINLINTFDQDQFVYSTQFDVEEPEIYSRVMQDPNSAEWAKAIDEELD